MLLTRRSMLGQCAAGAVAVRAAGASSAHSPMTLPSVAAMYRQLDGLLAKSGSGARRLRLGESSAGRPIDLISIGEGPKSVLLIGAPHPNEPVGCVSILRLIARLIDERRSTGRRDITWHFILAIDIDGLVLNDRWLGRPLTLTSYFDHFFRPPFPLQPEYSFPLRVGGYDFARSTPENLCWQKALAITKPDLQCSLHGSEHGGAFYILSADRPALADRLARQPSDRGLTLNPAGEPFTDAKIYRPGVTAFPPITAMVKATIAAGKNPSIDWGAGQSSAEFAAATYGTVSMTCEVPLWTDRRLTDKTISKINTIDILTRQIAESSENTDLLMPALQRLRGVSLGREGAALIGALEEALVRASAAGAKFQALQRRPPDADRPLAIMDYARLDTSLRLFGMRAPAMLARLANLARIPEIARDAKILLAKRIEDLDRDAKLEPVPVTAATSLQIAAVLTAAQATQTP